MTRFPTLSALMILSSCGGVALAQEQPAPLNPLTAYDIGSLTAFTERPLFSPTRRAALRVSAETVAATEPVPETVDIRLLGVVVSPEGAVARVANNPDGRSVTLRKGDTFQDWTVTAIDGSRLTLVKDGETMHLAVFKTPTSGSAVPATAPDAGASATVGTQPPSLGIPPDRNVRIIDTSKGTPPPAGGNHAQDLIDFFGTGTGPEE